MIKNTNSLRGVVIRFLTAPQKVWRGSPADSIHMWIPCSIFAFYLHSLLYSCLVSLHCIKYIFYSILLSVLFHLICYPSCLLRLTTSDFAAWSIGKSEEGEDESRRNTEDKDCTLSFFVLCLKSLLSGLIIMWTALWRSAALHSEDYHILCPFFCCAQSWGKIFKKEGRFLVTMEQCLCLSNCVHLLWALIVCTEFQHIFIN